MSMTKVLVVDDAVVVRRLISDVLSEDSEIEVVGVAANGRIALEKIDELSPDIVVLDIEMPVMNGLEALKEIRKKWPRLPVVMFSTLTDRGASATLEALALGADDYVTKPSNVGSFLESKEAIRGELIPKLKALSLRWRMASASSRKASPVKDSPPPRPTLRAIPSPQRIDILAIGVSTGGPNALDRVMTELPSDLPVPVVVVQHMPPVFTKSLAERLDSRSAVKVLEGEDGMLLEPGSVVIAPGGFHMRVERNGAGVCVRTNQDPPENSCRPAVDVLFRSVVEIYGAHTLGVIMTGMGQDGLCGCKCISEAGGRIVVQDEESSVVWGMPGFVAKAGLAEAVVPLSEIAKEIVVRLSHLRFGRA